MIYLDNAATTKPCRQAIEAFNLTAEKFYNPSSIYLPSIEVSREINAVRMEILNILGLTQSHSVIFTSGATESDNLALFQAKKFKGKTVLVSAGEHSAVYNCAKNLDGLNFETINLLRDGTVDEEDLKLKLAQGNICLVSIMQVNNETGAINNINKFAKIVKEFDEKILFHCDAVQGFKKIDYVFSSNVDFISLSSHKIGGFKGTGALVYKSSLNIKPQIFGGGQEFGLRSGTENVGGILAFGKALSKSFNYDHVKNLNILAREEISKKIPDVVFNGNGSPYILSVSIPKTKSEVIVRLLEEEGFCVSSGSACNSKKADNRVLSAMGIQKNFVEGTIRISFCDDNTKEEILAFADSLSRIVRKFRNE